MFIVVAPFSVEVDAVHIHFGTSMPFRRRERPSHRSMTTPRHEIALIVGAGSGLSASLARLFSREGMRVAIAARNAANLATLSGETGAQSFACDAVDPDQVARLFDDVESRLGMPDVVVYNASGRLRGSLIELVPAEVEHALR